MLYVGSHVRRLNGEYCLAVSNYWNVVASGSGYADRIHELMAVSRELSGDDKSSFQRNRSRNYLSEANYVEFSDVKVVGIDSCYCNPFQNVVFLMFLNTL